jgi:UDP-N-acetyl-D-mannosaminuronate dehydrogenase
MTNNTKHLVIGLGEVGMALVEVFKCDGEDKHKGIEAPAKGYKFLHIAFPYKDKNFIDEVKKYQEKFDPKYTIIHSTVPIGTSDACNALHSPIRGVHPHLADSIKTFKKFIGGADCFEIASEFKHFRIDCVCTRYARNTEALKLWDTTQYGMFIMLNKEINKYCEENKLDFNIVYTIANETYNEGYTKMLRPEVMRPFLEYKNEKIGGHCVIPNCKLLDSETPKKILKQNDLL